MRRKYSWRVKERKERLSATMPTKRRSEPIWEIASSWRSMPSFWSRNHQAGPSCILPGTRAVLEAGEQGGEHLGVARVDVVEDGLGQVAGGVERVQETDQGLGVGAVAHRVVAGVGPQGGEHRVVGVAQGADPHLHGPALLAVEPAELEQQGGGQLVAFEPGDSAAPARSRPKLASISPRRGRGEEGDRERGGRPAGSRPGGRPRARDRRAPRPGRRTS